MFRQTIISLQTKFWKTTINLLTNPTVWDGNPIPQPPKVTNRPEQWWKHDTYYATALNYLDNAAVWESSPRPGPAALKSRFLRVEDVFILPPAVFAFPWIDPPPILPSRVPKNVLPPTDLPMTYAALNYLDNPAVWESSPLRPIVTARPLMGGWLQPTVFLSPKGNWLPRQRRRGRR